MYIIIFKAHKTGMAIRIARAKCEIGFSTFRLDITAIASDYIGTFLVSLLTKL